jgi:phospholipid/cholesterol/gamma-HCH transport system ATP-binding protein
MSELPKITLKNIRKSFDEKQVLDGINLSVKSRESMVIIGGSGTGKSVLLKCILGLLEIDSGIISIDGQNFTQLNNKEREQINQKISMLFQGAALFDSIRVWENIAFGLIQSKKYNIQDAKEIAMESLIKVGLSKNVGNLYSSELSGGMQKRVGLARAISGSPEIIFFDEPTTGLDPIMADVINELIINCVKKEGITAISITHDMTSAKKIGDKIAMLYMGKIIWTGLPAEIESSGNRYVDQFINGRSTGPIEMDLRR